MSTVATGLPIAKSDRPIELLPQMANRHGLIAGATGTGKTSTLRVLAERLSAIGVPVFLADVKGDLSGLARAGGLYSTSSGDFVIAFTTAHRVPHHPQTPVLRQIVMAESMLAGQGWPAAPAINYLFQAAIEATEEAILNSLFAAETMVGRDGHTRYALPIEADQ
jgi:hypothetical protein